MLPPRRPGLRAAPRPGLPSLLPTGLGAAAPAIPSARRPLPLGSEPHGSLSRLRTRPSTGSPHTSVGFLTSSTRPCTRPAPEPPGALRDPRPATRGRRTRQAPPAQPPGARCSEDRGCEAVRTRNGWGGVAAALTPSAPARELSARRDPSERGQPTICRPHEARTQPQVAPDMSPAREVEEESPTRRQKRPWPFNTPLARYHWLRRFTSSPRARQRRLPAPES